MERILLVEDDAALRGGVALALASEQVSVCQCGTLGEAREALAERTFSLLILDVNLPDGSGMDFLQTLRQTGGPPVILLTANDLETDVVAGLTLGADDYITKPFSLAILRARVAAQLRKAAPQGATMLGRFRFDFEAMDFCVDGQPVELSKTEQKLLRLLTENRGSTVSRSVLLERIWPDGAEYVEENALSVTVKRLRGKLPGAPIKTVYGLGYSWAVES